MSHIVTITTQVRDPVAVSAACGRLGLPAPVAGVHRLFSAEAEGRAVALAGWRYPLVCETAAGRLHYDTYGGRWGAEERLGEFVQAYAVEKATLEARRAGHSVTERRLPCGSVRLTLGGTP